jgi:hypothetical protein
MAKQTINIGVVANDGTGDTLRAALDKCNDNFDELYTLTDGSGAADVLTLTAGTASLGDTTISDATPILIFKDSDCADADDNFTVTAAATDTGSGTEDIDVTFAQQVAGAAKNFLVADADGSITLGDGTRALVLSGAVTSGDSTISDATPQLAFRDSSCAVARDNASILVAATDTGDGTEDADVTLYQHVAGSATAFLVSDADGALTLGRSGQAIVLNGAVGDLTLKDSTPVLALIDTDAVDGDAGISITATCTTVTAGAEHVDATFAQQVAGSPVTFLLADADGSITLGDGTRALVLSGAATVGDLIISDATPQLSLKDSSCAVADVNALIKADATDTGDGTEDIDVTFQQQVAGTITTFLVSDADGALTLGQTSQPIVLNGPVGNVTLEDAAPTLVFKDSSCDDADDNFDIVVAATDTGSGTEDIDVVLSAQVAGTKVAFLTFDADGALTLGNTGQSLVLNGPAGVGDLTISDASPVLAMKDSDCTDSDVNFDITVAATDTGTGAEDIDVAFAAQVAGTKVTFLNFDADGQLALGYGGQPVYIAKLQSAVTVTPNAGAATPSSTDSGTAFTNEGDADGSSVTLPSAAAGLQFTFYVQAAQTLTVTANTDDTIRIASSVTAAAGSITSSVVGSSVTLTAINATEWVATASVGSWTI